MRCIKKPDIHTDAGYRRMTGDDDEVKGYGLRGMNLMRRGITPTGKQAVHFIEALCKSHRLKIRSSYASEALAATHGFDDAYPTLVTLHELTSNVLKPEELKQLRERGGLGLDVTLTVDAESVFKSLTSKDLKTPTEKTLLGHISWLRELLDLGLIDKVCWCDTRDMTADGHTKGSISRDLLLKLMDGVQTYDYDVKVYTPYRRKTDSKPTKLDDLD